MCAFAHDKYTITISYCTDFGYKVLHNFHALRPKKEFFHLEVESIRLSTLASSINNIEAFVDSIPLNNKYFLSSEQR